MILEYTIQVIVFQLVFLLVYDMFLKNETFFNYNRIYLLLTPVLALVLPLLRLEFLVEVVPANARINLPEVFIGTRESAIEILPTVVVSEESTFSINWWLATYILGVCASLFLFFKKYYRLNKLFSLNKIAEERNFKIIEIPNSNLAYTFFNTIFLGDQLSNEEKDQILSHEMVHVKQKHSLDLVFFELLKIIFWFNPLVYIYQTRIAGVHEFIADKEVVKTTAKKTYYEQLLNTAFSTQNISFINQFFNHSLIKKRIFMLQKNKSSRLSKFKFLIIIPLMMLMLTYVACSEDNSADLDSEMPETTTSEIIAKLKVHLENKESLSQEEKEQFLQLLEKREELLDKEAQANGKIVESFPRDGLAKVPFAVVDQVPVFPGCENLGSNEVQKKCMSDKISQFVSKNFDTSLGKKLGLTGLNRVIVQFRIDETGAIADIKARAAHPELEDEAKKVISNIPQMQPGEQKGRAVSVMYSLPIAFKVAE
ncbi:M56 family metallopeptidase [Christiangramia forsetii]|uniref:BlaR1 peptidase M56 n=2 Tax=Christiangramia forsetii TaxID=411153 RepID=A0LXH2_CHRFK|nr:M56 family metallopeptidase [Christiangramia forsetii]GGG36831.1 hypothetical protein GCM10011532_20660 [Christiangramia forsetii]CAL65067.1 conserved hypothetical protein, membrane [Christiangramia forsetii KT0803]